MEQSSPSQLTLELPVEDSIKRVHPSLYKVLQPNVFINGATAHFSLSQFKVFTEILSIDHKLEPNKHMYSFPYLQLYERTKNPSRNIDNLRSMFLGSSLVLPKEYATKVYGKNLGTIISLFNTIIYRTGYVDVEMHKDFKKLLVLTENHYTKGELDLLKGFKSEYSHKLYWIVRMNQPFKETMTLSMEDFRSAIGIVDKYPRISDITTRVLKVAEEDLKKTWAEFGYSYIKENNKAVGIRLYFKSDKKLIEYLKSDIRYEFEDRLDTIGVDIAQIMKYRKLIVDGEHINASICDMKWNFYYIGRTIQLVQKNNRVKHKAAYTVDCLDKGYYLQQILDETDDIILGDIESHPLGHQVKEGVKIRQKVINRSALVTMEDMEKDIVTFEIEREEYLKLTNRKIVTYEKRKYGVNCDLVPDEVTCIDGWKIIEDIETE